MQDLCVCLHPQGTPCSGDFRRTLSSLCPCDLPKASMSGMKPRDIHSPPLPLFPLGIYRGHCFRINHFPEDNDYDHDSSEYLLRE